MRWDYMQYSDTMHIGQNFKWIKSCRLANSVNPYICVLALTLTSGGRSIAVQQDKKAMARGGGGGGREGRTLKTGWPKQSELEVEK